MVPAIKKGHISTIALWHYYTQLIVNTVFYYELYHRWEGQEHNYLQCIIYILYIYIFIIIIFLLGIYKTS